MAPDRISVLVEGIRHYIEAEAGSTPVAIVCRQLMEEALRARQRSQTIAEILQSWNSEQLAKASGIEIERLTDLMVGEIPTNAELVKLSRCLLLNTEELALIRDRNRKPQEKK